ncbi:hypothetical protein [Primorskyibacter sp. S87]|uniref:hypothetical protein n=1 Tax=Primorskyibacter sp. S87 TaxID=3415126 RepID=UPI003C7DFE3A
MLVTDIEITHYTYCAQTGRHSANVCMTLRDQIVTMFCRLDLGLNGDAQGRARAFVADALRQLNRMPEIRSGRDTVNLAEDLVPALA